MQSALRSVDGVENVEIDFDHKTAKVTCNGYCDHEALVAALEKANYGGRVRE